MTLLMWYSQLRNDKLILSFFHFFVAANIVYLAGLVKC